MVNKKFSIYLHAKALIFLICFLLTNGQCPPKASLHPCLCRESLNGEEIAELSCQGDLGLVRLTALLRKDLCGQSIEQFKLIDSDVGYLPSNLFYKVSVKDIQISFTNISHFTKAGRSAFFGLEHHLASLSMRRCHLVDELQWQKVGELQALTYLDLSYNQLTGVPQKWFGQPPPNLLSLILKGNKISYLESGSFTRMFSLIELDLSENQIARLTRDIFPNPGNALIFLRLSENKLPALPMDLFDEMMGLRRIYLDGNGITELPQALWSSIWGDLEHLDINDNPLRCDCNMSWVARLRPPKRLYATCDYFNLASAKLRDLEEEDFNFCPEDLSTNLL